MIKEVTVHFWKMMKITVSLLPVMANNNRDIVSIILDKTEYHSNIFPVSP